MKLPAADPAYSSRLTEFFFLDACGDEGRRWNAELDSLEIRCLRSDLLRALKLLRAHRLREGRELLTSVEFQLRDYASASPSIIHLLWRYFFSTMAYLHYLADDLSAARARLEQAGDEIRTILEIDRFLLPLAIHCTDFIIQKARIARRERNWREVKSHISVLGQIAEGESPYCILRTGEPIRLTDLEAFFAALPLNKEQRERAYLFLRGELSAAERTIRISERIFTFPDMVIPYP